MSLLNNTFRRINLKKGAEILAILTLIYGSISGIRSFTPRHYHSFFKVFWLLDTLAGTQRAFPDALAETIGAILLFYGAKNRNRDMTIPWMICSIKTMSIFFYTCWDQVIHDFKMDQFQNFTLDLFLSIGLICGCIYSWLLVFNFYKQLREEDKNANNASYDSLKVDIQTKEKDHIKSFSNI